jgi:hypothetical protein
MPVSAIVYLTLCVWLGPTVAFWLTAIGGWTLFWFYLCGRVPILDGSPPPFSSASSAGSSALAAAAMDIIPSAGSVAA